MTFEVYLSAHVFHNVLALNVSIFCRLLNGHQLSE